MSNETVAYKPSISGTMGAGLGALVAPSDKKYFILEHKVSSKYHKAGENQEIIIDQIILGRDPNCQVRFDEKFNLVSRRHAAIVRDGDNWKLVQLSQTNSTFLNGEPITGDWYLQNGDEIQLAVNGPKLGFIVPSGNNASVKSLGMTKRLSLFRQQALRPYRIGISCALALVLLVGGFAIWNHIKITELERIAKETQTEIAEMNADLNTKIDGLKAETAQLKTITDSLTQGLEDLKNNLTELGGKVGELEKNTQDAIEKLNKKADAAISQAKKAMKSAAASHSDIANWDKSTYLLFGEGIVLIDGNGNAVPIEKNWCGTGFLLSDGTLATARHMVQPWLFPNSEDDLILSAYAEKGLKVEAVLKAISASGEQFEVHTSMFKVDDSRDKTGDIGNGVIVRIAEVGPTDWATFKTDLKNGLSKDANQSNNMKRGDKVYFSGFQNGLGASNAKPLYSEGTIASDGLQGGMLYLTGCNIDHGNSGGAAMYNNKVIGIVSGGTGRNVGLIVPISAIGN